MLDSHSSLNIIPSPQLTYYLYYISECLSVAYSSDFCAIFYSSYSCECVKVSLTQVTCVPYFIHYISMSVLVLFTCSLEWVFECRSLEWPVCYIYFIHYISMSVYFIHYISMSVWVSLTRVTCVVYFIHYISMSVYFIHYISMSVWVSLTWVTCGLYFICYVSLSVRVFRLCWSTVLICSFILYFFLPSIFWSSRLGERLPSQTWQTETRWEVTTPPVTMVTCRHSSACIPHSLKLS